MQIDPPPWNLEFIFISERNLAQVLKKLDTAIRSQIIIAAGFESMKPATRLFERKMTDFVLL